MTEFTLYSETTNPKLEFIHLSGDMGSKEVGGFERATAKALDSGVQAMIIECSDIENITSYSLGIMAQAADQLRSRGGKLVLLAAHEKLRELIGLLSLSSLFSLAATLDEAKALAMQDNNPGGTGKGV